MARYIDVHCHLHEFKDDEIQRLLDQLDVVIIAVSDDLESARRTLQLAREYSGRVYPCVGLHPWSIKEVEEPVKQAREIARLAVREGVWCIGEVGLDTKFVPETIDVQRQVFNVFLETAVELDAFMNLHTAGTWEEVLKIISERGVRRANFHWYTGPLHLLEKIREFGYTISINPAVKIQKKHIEVVKHASLDIMLTESDGPYDYRGLHMTPLLIPEVVKAIAELKNIDVSRVEEAVRSNARRILGINI